MLVSGTRWEQSSGKRPADLLRVQNCSLNQLFSSAKPKPPDSIYKIEPAREEQNWLSCW